MIRNIVDRSKKRRSYSVLETSHPDCASIIGSMRFVDEFADNEDSSQHHEPGRPGLGSRARGERTSTSAPRHGKTPSPDGRSTLRPTPVVPVTCGVPAGRLSPVAPSGQRLGFMTAGESWVPRSVRDLFTGRRDRYSVITLTQVGGCLCGGRRSSTAKRALWTTGRVAACVTPGGSTCPPRAPDRNARTGRSRRGERHLDQRCPPLRSTHAHRVLHAGGHLRQGHRDLGQGRRAVDGEVGDAFSASVPGAADHPLYKTPSTTGPPATAPREYLMSRSTTFPAIISG